MAFKNLLKKLFQDIMGNATCLQTGNYVVLS